jgi:hypothetical protein
LSPKYDTDPTHHWALKNFSFLDTGSGGNIIATTDKPCHLTEFWALKKPGYQKFYMMLRGISVYCGKKWKWYQPFYTEQSEPGDTIIHTFAHPTWPACKTHWWVFYGTVTGINSPSSCCLMKYHRVTPPYGPPVTARFYPTLGHAGIAADGRTQRAVYGSWTQLRNGNGTMGRDTEFQMFAMILSGFSSPNWYFMERAPMYFDTRPLPNNAIISLAKVGVWGVAKDGALSTAVSLALVHTIDITPGSITMDDFQHLQDYLIADKIPYADFKTGQFNVFTLYPAYFPLIDPAGPTLFGLREGTFDLPDIAPPWKYYAQSLFSVYQRDYDIYHSPYLEVTYKVPL